MIIFGNLRTQTVDARGRLQGPLEARRRGCGDRRRSPLRHRQAGPFGPGRRRGVPVTMDPSPPLIQGLPKSGAESSMTRGGGRWTRRLTTTTRLLAITTPNV